MLRNTTAGLPRVTKSSCMIRTLLAVICGKSAAANGSSGQGGEMKRPLKRPVNSHHLSGNRNDRGLVLTDYEDLKKTGYLEVVTVLSFDANIAMAYSLKFYSFEVFRHQQFTIDGACKYVVLFKWVYMNSDGKVSGCFFIFRSLYRSIHGI